MIGNDEQALLTKAKPFAFLCRRYHLKGLAGTYYVRQKRIAAVKDMSNSIDLVWSQCDFGIDADKAHVTAVVFTRSERIELLVIHLGELFSALRITPNPVSKGLLDKLLLALCDSGFFLIEHSRFLAVLILDIVKDSHILEVEGFFHDLIAVDSCRAESIVRFDISTVVGFTLDIPFSGVLRIVNMDVPLAIPRCAEQLKHELLHDLRRKPRCAEPYGNLTCRQINWLHCLKSTDILAVIIGIKVCTPFGNRQLLADIT